MRQFLVCESVASLKLRFPLFLTDLIQTPQGIIMCVTRLLLVLLLFHAPVARASAQRPADVATRFYGWVIKYSGGGLPSEPSLNAGEYLLSDELIRLMRAAQSTEKLCVASTPPDLKPMIFEGDMFVDNYEGLTKVLSMRLQRTGERILVRSRLEYKEGKTGSDAIAWSDRMILVREKGKWVVGDVGGHLRTKTLVATLKRYISAACHP